MELLKCLMELLNVWVWDINFDPRIRIGFCNQTRTGPILSILPPLNDGKFVFLASKLQEGQ